MGDALSDLSTQALPAGKKLGKLLGVAHPTCVTLRPAHMPP